MLAQLFGFKNTNIDRIFNDYLDKVGIAYINVFLSLVKPQLGLRMLT